MSSPRPGAATLVAFCAFAVAACGGGGGEGTTFEVAQGSDRDFVATTVDGDQLALADYAGEDVMLWFWAPW